MTPRTEPNSKDICKLGEGEIILIPWRSERILPKAAYRVARF